MSYSCTTRANAVLDRISEMCRDQSGFSNVWYKGERKFFFEVGREQSDGSITGSVMEFVGENAAARKGNFRIEPNGAMPYFPNLNKEIRKMAKEESRVQMEFAKGAMFVVGA